MESFKISADCLSICLMTSRRVVSGLKCLRDLDLSVKILNHLNHFLGHCLLVIKARIGSIL